MRHELTWDRCCPGSYFSSSFIIARGAGTKVRVWFHIDRTRSGEWALELQPVNEPYPIEKYGNFRTGNDARRKATEVICNRGL